MISLDSDSDADDAPTPAPAAAATSAEARLEAEKSAEVTTWLREVANGTRPVPGILASPEYWEELGAPARDAANARGRERYRARMKLRARCEPALAPGETIVWPHLGDDYNHERLSLIRQNFLENGYAQFPSFAVACRTPTRTAARTAMSSRVPTRVPRASRRRVICFASAAAGGGRARASPSRLTDARVGSCSGRWWIGCDVSAVGPPPRRSCTTPRGRSSTRRSTSPGCCSTRTRTPGR